MKLGDCKEEHEERKTLNEEQYKKKRNSLPYQKRGISSLEYLTKNVRSAFSMNSVL